MTPHLSSIVLSGTLMLMGMDPMCVRCCCRP